MEKIKEKKWIVAEPNIDLVNTLVEGGFDEILSKILLNRNIETIESAKKFISSELKYMADPSLMKGMDIAAERVCNAIANKEKICIYGDYDADGITSTATITRFLQGVGALVEYYIPHRIDDGYGLNSQAIESIANSGVKVIISVDCGITSVKEADLCKRIGVDLIITDHHVPPECLPDAYSILNPLQDGCLYPFKYLAGVGVAFNFVVGIRKALDEKGFFKDKEKIDLRPLLSYVSIGTVGDVVPLVEENRIFVKYGLEQVRLGVYEGIAAIREIATNKKGVLSAGTLGFRVCPMINAAGRIDTAGKSIKMLMTDDELEANSLSKELEADNILRQKMEEDIRLSAFSMIDSLDNSKKSIVLMNPEWHAGVVGIVASRVVEAFYRPTLLLTTNKDGLIKGSGRSIPEVDIHKAICLCSKHLKSYGGHKHAVGLSLEPQNLPAFIDDFESAVFDMVKDKKLLPKLDIDVEIMDAASLNFDFIDNLSGMAPFGTSNKEPVFVLRNVSIVKHFIMAEKHFKIDGLHGITKIKAVMFNSLDIPTTKLVDLVFTVDKNYWNNNMDIQFILKDIRSSLS